MPVDYSAVEERLLTRVHQSTVAGQLLQTILPQPVTKTFKRTRSAAIRRAQRGQPAAALYYARAYLSMLTEHRVEVFPKDKAEEIWDHCMAGVMLIYGDAVQPVPPWRTSNPPAKQHDLTFYTLPRR